MTRPVPASTFDDARRLEGLWLTAKIDAVGRVTVGYGHTDPSLEAGTIITLAQADAYLRNDLLKAASIIARTATTTQLNDNQYSALLLFVLNTGGLGESIPVLLRAGHAAQVPAVMKQWNHVHINGRLVVMRGLTNRRAAEIEVWNRP